MTVFLCGKGKGKRMQRRSVAGDEEQIESEIGGSQPDLNPLSACRYAGRRWAERAGWQVTFVG
jgi:hypothetical protein